MSTNKTIGTTNPPASAVDAPAAGTSTAETIRNALRGKAKGETTHSRGGGYGADPKPPRPPHGTRRSMGKR